MPETTRELTFGEKAVGLTFNPSGDEKVNAIKIFEVQNRKKKTDFYLSPLQRHRQLKCGLSKL